MSEYKTKPHKCIRGSYTVEEIKGTNPRRLIMLWPELEMNRFGKKVCENFVLKTKEVFTCPFCGEKA